MELRTMPLKFRVWDKEEKGLIYDAELAYDYLYPDHNPLCVHNFYELIEDERYIISQDTGLKDKNGKSIFTGDIVEKRYSSDIDFYGVRGVCFYKDGMVDFDCVIGNDNIEGFIEEYEIVGNIWQNPELLRGGIE